jgi:hypothetical protein
MLAVGCEHHDNLPRGSVQDRRRPQDLVARIAADAAALQRDPDPKIDPGPRLDAVGGSLTIVSAPGDGSSVGGRVPVA